MSDRDTPGFHVVVCDGAVPEDSRGAIEIDVGACLPVAYTGMRKLLLALGVAQGASHAPERKVLFPGAAARGRNLLDIADAPNQRRLFRESEQTFRVLTFAAHALVEAVGSLGRPLILRNAGACDLVSLRGLMHAVQCSRLADVREHVYLCDWNAAPPLRSPRFAGTRAEQLDRILTRMRATRRTSGDAPDTAPLVHDPTSGLEARYLARALDHHGSLEGRVAAALLAIRACFFSTSYEGAMLAADTALGLLTRAGNVLRVEALLAAWDAQDDPRLDIPMLELDRDCLGDADQVRALVLLHLGVVHVFTGHPQEALHAFGRALEGSLSPEMRADLYMYRAVVASKMLGDVPGARREIAAGLAALAGRPRAVAGTHQAWLHNLSALTYVQQKDLAQAEREETRALACIDEMPGPSAAHLKTNLVSNFSVLYEAKRDLPMATRIWQSFAPLNEKLGSDAADKVYLNRLGALQRESGDVESALASYAGAFAKAEVTGDEFHAETIAGTIARVHLDRGGPGDREEAATWYRAAAERARSSGDCVQLAKDLAGLSLATGDLALGAACEALEHDSTDPAEGRSLGRAFASGDGATIRAALPGGKSKLSRPFTVVNV